MMHRKRVFKNAGIISLAILFSRVLGFVRDVIIAALLGTGSLAQAFVVAFRLPNLLRDVVAEGAANSAIIPVLAEYKARVSREEYYRVLASLQTTMLYLLFGLTFVGVIFAPLIVAMIAPGFLGQPSLYSQTVILARWIFPFLFFVGLFGLNMSILHTEERFLSTSLGQPMFNLLMIVSLLIFGMYARRPVLALVAGVWLGGLGLVAFQLMELRKIGYFPIRLSREFHPAIRKIFQLMIPRLVGTVIYHLNILADTVLASLSAIVGVGAIAGIYYANRIIQFPLAMFSVSVAQAVLPRLSHLKHSDDTRLAETFRSAVELVFFLIVPSAVFLFLSAEPVVRVLLGRGAFGDYSVRMTADLVRFYSLGLVFFAGIKMLVSAFHSLQDTRTPVKTAGISLVVNVVLDVLLMFPLGAKGLALASSLAGLVNFALLAYLLNRRINLISRDLILELLKLTCTAGIMVVFLRIFWAGIREVDFLILLRAMVVSAGAFLIGCGVFKIKMWRELVMGGGRWLYRRMGRGE